MQVQGRGGPLHSTVSTHFPADFWGRGGGRGVGGGAEKTTSNILSVQNIRVTHRDREIPHASHTRIERTTRATKRLSELRLYLVRPPSFPHFCVPVKHTHNLAAHSCGIPDCTCTHRARPGSNPRKPLPSSSRCAGCIGITIFARFPTVDVPMGHSILQMERGIPSPQKTILAPFYEQHQTKMSDGTPGIPPISPPPPGGARPAPLWLPHGGWREMRVHIPSGCLLA